jgi:hypothetical protein
MEQSKKIKIDELCYYFDGQERDSIDVGTVGGRIYRATRVRDRLLQVSPVDFHRIASAMEKLLIPDSAADDPGDRLDMHARQRDVLKLAAS